MKSIFKKWYFWVIVVLLLFGLFNKKDSKNENLQENSESIVEIKENPEELKEDNSTVNEKDLEAFVPHFTKIADDNFPSENYNKNIYVKDDTVYFELSSNGLASDIMLHPNEAKDLGEIMLDTAKSCWETEKTFVNNDNVHFVLNLLNDENTENSIIYIVDDAIVYNAIDELQ